MKYIELKVSGAYLIEIEPMNDDRGFFSREFCGKDLKEKTGIDFELAQSSISYNIKKGTIRGMHFLNPPYQEIKIVSCVRGAIFDVVLDLRKDSPSYLQWDGAKLTGENYKMLLIPEDCAHGFQSLKDETVLNYKINQYYTPNADSGVRYDDKAFGIEFPIKEGITISDKDKNFDDYIV